MGDSSWREPRLVAAVQRWESTPSDTHVDLSLEHLAAVRDDPEAATMASGLFADNLVPQLDELRERARGLATGPAAADARGLLAETLVSAAGEIRGGDFAKNVAPGAWGPFTTLLAEADRVGEEALELVPDHPVAAIARMADAVPGARGHAHRALRQVVRQRPGDVGLRRLGL